MSIPFNSLVGDQFSNSYVDITYATDYCDNHYDATKGPLWDGLSPVAQQRLLIHACHVIETARFTNDVRPAEYLLFYDYNTGTVRQLAERMEPVRFYLYQSLQFPRNRDIAYYTEAPNYTAGQLFIPEALKMAQCEQALWLLSYDGGNVASRTQGVVNETVGLGRSLHVTQQYVADGSAYAPMALELVRPYFLKSGQRMRRG